MFVVAEVARALGASPWCHGTLGRTGYELDEGSPANLIYYSQMLSDLTLNLLAQTASLGHGSRVAFTGRTVGLPVREMELLRPRKASPRQDQFKMLTHEHEHSRFRCTYPYRECKSRRRPVTVRICERAGF